MDEKKIISQYCIGCGLCKVKRKASVSVNSKGYYEITDGDLEWLKKICPSFGNQTKSFNGSLWGYSEKVFLGWSKDDNVRRQASSGGVLTEIASVLLELNMVDGIIHTKSCDTDPTQTESCISCTRNELIERCGSRYAISHPLEIIEKIDLSKRYGFIGKPCDVDALNNAFEIYPDIKNSILYTISFFCAGLPSFDAQNSLLKALGCSKKECRSLRYRGDGWPGFATACDNSGIEHKMDYDSSWGKILGRDVMPMCRVCLNGIGETADVACADGWYLTECGKPDFSEKEGRNVIFARTKKGLDLIKTASERGKIYIEEFSDSEKQLPKMQYFQAGRRQSMLAKKKAMRLYSRAFPKYPQKIMKQYSKTASFIYRLKIFKGTVDRIRAKKI